MKEPARIPPANMATLRQAEARNKNLPSATFPLSCLTQAQEACASEDGVIRTKSVQTGMLTADLKNQHNALFLGIASVLTWSLWKQLLTTEQASEGSHETE